MSDQAWIVASNIQNQRLARQREEVQDDYSRLRNMYNSLREFAKQMEQERDDYKSKYEALCEEMSTLRLEYVAEKIHRHLLEDK